MASGIIAYYPNTEMAPNLQAKVDITFLSQTETCPGS